MHHRAKSLDITIMCKNFVRDLSRKSLYFLQREAKMSKHAFISHIFQLVDRFAHYFVIANFEDPQRMRRAKKRRTVNKLGGIK